ncbi:MAG: bifunctional phosphopantothenoylcysteine decarboxylase/phosphopantothenate--cysteine ligase CoaBC [bacterium]|nr:bifunctional phosphopantothenoylcysteine decarboxylase/phosphopantothenate--cysteine ligase CoaBC [bacterium]
MLTGKKILLGISGGIAAYKCCELIRLLVKENAEVRVMTTPNALHFVTKVTLEALSRNPVQCDDFPIGVKNNISHIELAKWADALLIAPASANTIAKLRMGIADNVVTTTTLVFNRPYLIAPAMNSQMWNNPATQENLEVLKNRGVILIGPEFGEMAAANEEVGFGRMTEPKDLLTVLARFIDFKDVFHQKKVLVVAGGTSEPIDGVRVITNRSTGTLGKCIAEKFIRRNAQVTLLASENITELPYGIPSFSFNTVDSLHKLLTKHLPHHDIWIMCAAVSDRKPKGNWFEKKLKKEELGTFLEWEPTIDLIQYHSKENPNCVIIGFSLEDHWDEQIAREKLIQKNATAIVWNNPLRSDTGFGNLNLEAKLIDDHQTMDWGVLSREELATNLVEYCSRYV